jgi:flagellar biogenesis protein FliO
MAFDLISLPLILRWAGALLLTLCLMCLSLYLLQGSQDKLRNRPGRRMKKLETLNLTRTNSVHIVEVDGQTFLATTTQHQTTLQKMSEPGPTAPETDLIPRKPR